MLDGFSEQAYLPLVGQRKQLNDFQIRQKAMGSSNFGAFDALAFASAAPANNTILRGILACAMVSDRT